MRTETPSPDVRILLWEIVWAQFRPRERCHEWMPSDWRRQAQARHEEDA